MRKNTEINIDHDTTINLSIRNDSKVSRCKKKEERRNINGRIRGEEKEGDV